MSAAGYNHKTSDPVEVIDPSLPSLGRAVTISLNANVATGTKLTASYGGSEGVTIAWQWHKDNDDIPGETSDKYMPTLAGGYTVTAKADGYNHKTSGAVTVIGNPTWTAVTTSTFGTSYIIEIAWGNNKFVAGGNDGKMAWAAD